MSVVRQLLQNDPLQWSISIHLHRDGIGTDAEMAAALERNEFVTKIVFRWDGDRLPRLDALLRVVATHERLEKVMLMEENGLGAPRQPVARILPFVQAIQRNHRIQSVHLSVSLSAELIVTLLGSPKTYEELFLDRRCEVEEPDETGRGARDLALAFQRSSTSIKSLHLWRPYSLYEPILQGLRANSSLKKLDIFLARETPEEAIRAVQELLASTTTIQEFNLSGRYTKRNFRPIAEALIESDSISEIVFQNSFFVDECSALVVDILRSKNNLCSFTFGYFSFQDVDHDRAVEFFQELVATLVRPQSPLRSLGIAICPIDETLPHDSFRLLLDAVTQSKLERLSLEWLSCVRHANELCHKIPEMKIKELYMELHRNLDRLEDLAPAFLRALRRNFSIQSMDAYRGGRLLFEDAADEDKLAFFMSRNTRLADWVDNPTTIPQELWPQAMNLALQAGENVLFQCLRKLSGQALGFVQGKRKRKRP